MIINIFLLLILTFLLLLGITVLTHIFFLVPYVPTSKRVVEKMVRVARLKPKETVFDIGCGDGRLLFAAEKKTNVKTVGFEIAPLVYFLALMRKFFAHSKAKILFKNFLKANLKRANVIFCYLIPGVMPELAKKIKHECKKGTRVISNTFKIPGLKPHKTFSKDPLKKLPTIYVYRI